MHTKAIQLAAPETEADTPVTANQGSHVAYARPVLGADNQPPVYPAEAQLHGECGRVLLSIDVSPDGTAAGVKVEQSSGYQVLDRSAVDAVLKWRFLPSYRSSGPVASVLPYWISFKLD
jgi:protein TonB